ncbi:MAG: MCP four helix bundle domain-containing protein, partial [Burkholderiaceae bacterium]|nr:MCP four helix bundle domain-containing protein [Burkholderiaceae bacterium]
MTMLQRLLYGFGTLLALFVLVTAYALYEQRQAQAAMQRIVEVNQRKITLLGEMKERVLVGSRLVRTLFLLDDPAAREELQKQLEETRAGYEAAWKALQQFPADAETAALRQRIEEARKAAEAVSAQVLALAAEIRTMEAISLLRREGAPATDRWLAALNENIAL